MQHFGGKQELFRAAVDLDLDVAVASAGPVEGQHVRVLRAVFEHMDRRPEVTAATLRSMLTHDESAEEALKLFNLSEMHKNAAEPLPDDDLAALRGRLVGALTLGTAVARYVLKFSAVDQASIDQLVTCLAPALDALQPVRKQTGDEGGC